MGLSDSENYSSEINLVLKSNQVESVAKIVWEIKKQLLKV